MPNSHTERKEHPLPRVGVGDVPSCSFASTLRTHTEFAQLIRAPDAQPESFASAASTSDEGPADTHHEQPDREGVDDRVEDEAEGVVGDRRKHACVPPGTSVNTYHLLGSCQTI